MKTFYLLIVMICLSSVVVFGANDPNYIDNVKMFSNGDGYTVALKNDGTVWGMGRNDKGQLHYDFKGDIKSWYRLPLYIRVAPKKVEWINVVSVSAGYMQSAAIDDKGDVWYWGYRYSSYNGRSMLDRFAPSKVKDLKNIVKISFSIYGYCAIDKDGVLWEIDNSSKVRKTQFTKVKQIAFTERMTLILTEGKVYSWTASNPTVERRNAKDITEIQSGKDDCLMTDKNYKVYLINEFMIADLICTNPPTEIKLGQTANNKFNLNTTQINNLKKRN